MNLAKFAVVPKPEPVTAESPVRPEAQSVSVRNAGCPSWSATISPAQEHRNRRPVRGGVPVTTPCHYACPVPLPYGYAIRSLPHAVELADYELKRAAALSKLDAVDEAQVRR